MEEGIQAPKEAGMKYLSLANSDQLVMVDDDIYEQVKDRSWRLIPVSGGKIYVGWKTHKNGKDVTVYLHRLVMGFPKGMVDHWDHNIFDCRRENLRVVTNSQNQMNSQKRDGTSSRYKGVYWVKKIKKWKAQIMDGGKSYFLGYFAPSQERYAAYAYDFAAIELFGEHAYLNFPNALRGD